MVVDEASGKPSVESAPDAALAASEERFRALVDNSSDCIFLVDAQGDFVYVSPAVLGVLGYEAGELLGHPAATFAHPEDVALAQAARLSPPGTRIEGTIRARHKDGSWRWLEGTATNLLHHPAVRAIVNNRTDVTARREAEKERRFQEALLSQVNEAILASDPEARIVYWNEAAERLYGYSAAEAIGADGTSLLKHRWPNPADVAGHRDALRATGSWRGEMIHTTRAGDEINVEASIRILRDEGGRPIAAINVMQDVTAKRRLEEQLRHAQKMDAIGVFAGGVAHDFNNLLSVILGFSDITLQRLPASHPDAHALREVADAAKRGAELTRQLLAFSRKQIMRLAPVDLNTALVDFGKLLSRIIGEDVDLVVRPSGAPIVVRADGGQLEQILLNLSTNARQAMPSGGSLEISARAIVLDVAFAQENPWARAGHFAELSVRDTGIGMDAATRGRIFEPFFTTKDQGTGLGLASVYGIVQQHGGFIHAESAPGTGATFRVYLPLLQDASPSVDENPSEPPAPGGDETVLVAEDAPPLRALFAEALTSLGYRVIQAEDGERAVQEYALHADEISLVLLDVVMPKLGGVEAYGRMRAIRRDVKVLLTTGYAPEAARLAETIERERLPLLEKPFSTRTLGLSVRRAIDCGSTRGA